MCPKKRRELALLEAKREWNTVKHETFNKGDLMDYDGMGNWGRFPTTNKNNF